MFRTSIIATIMLLIVGSVCRAADSSDSMAISHQLDQIVAKAAVAKGVTPLDHCEDLEFLRRIWLDLAGRTPPLSEVTRVMSEKTLDREETVKRLLKTPEYSRTWGRIWSEYLTGQRPFDEDGEYDRRQLMLYLTAAFRENRPYDEIVRDLVLGEGTSDIHGSVNFLLRYNAEPVPLAGAVSQKLLGVSMQCAECHDHPHARWKQKDFWGLAAHFARLRKMNPTNPEEGESFFVVIERPRGELMVADKKAKPNEAGEIPKKTVYPQLPDQPRSDLTRQRRTVLVEWLNNPNNPYPSRHLVNIIWERLMGARLVTTLDQWPPQTSSTESDVLNLLATDLINHDWDLQRLIQVIALSDAYQRSSHSPADTKPISAEQMDKELTHWARGHIRAMSADQLHLSIAQAFGYHHDENEHRLAESTGEEFTQDIPVNNLGSTSLTLGRALSLYNSDYIRGAAELGAEAAIRLYGATAGAEQIERMFLSLLSRRPTIEELEFFQDLGGESNAQQGLQDIAWTLLNSAEFVTNH